MPKPIRELLPRVKQVWHPWHLWECHPAGFYSSAPTDIDGVEGYQIFLSNIPLFRKALQQVVNEWVYSCEQHLTNQQLNRIAWLGQASACIQENLPSCCRGGFSLLTREEQIRADYTAREFLLCWLKKRPKEKGTARGISLGGSCKNRHRIRRYVRIWKTRGYPKDIPDTVPNALLQLNKAPSYRAICLALLTNDFSFSSLGFSPRVSPYYHQLKKIEIENRKK